MNKEIDNYIYGLDYDPSVLLAYEGTTIENLCPQSGVEEDGKYIVITREKCTLEENFDVCVSDENRNVTYPGGLLYANKKLVDGVPTPLQLDRGSVKVTLNLPGMVDDNFMEVKEVDYGNVTQAMNQILDAWYEKYTDYNTIPANMSFVGAMAYDKNELALKLGCNVSFLENKMGIDFEAISKNETSVYVAKYKQIFYTASIEPFSNPSDAFAEHITVDDLRIRNVDESQPPAYVNAVSYGREIYVKFESDCSKQKLSEALEAAVTYEGITPGADQSASIDNETKNIRCTLIVLGGSSEMVEGLYSDGDLIKKINEIIFSNTVLSKNNPAYPLGYKVMFLKNNEVAKFCGTTEYVEEKYEEFSSGELTLRLSGAYVAKFYVSWKELSFDNNGNAVYTDKSWGGNGHHKTAGFLEVIPFGGNVRKINLKGQGATGLVWDPWHTPFDRTNMPLVPKMSLELTGTTLNQKATYKES